LQHRLAKILPHVIDSILLGSALTLAWLSGQYPLVQPWLTAKLFGLLAYIVLGAFALRRGRTRRSRALYFAAALLTYGYIVSVAMTRSPLPYF